MVNVAQGLALGGASRAFRAADERAIQREGITSREKIAGNRLRADQEKLITERSTAALTSIIGEIKATKGLLTSATSDRDRHKINKRIDSLQRAGEQVLGTFNPERLDNPIVFANGKEQLRLAVEDFESAELAASAAGRAEGVAAAASAPGAAVKAGTIAEAQEAAKKPTPTTGGKRINLIRELSKELNRVNEALKTTPDNPVLQAEKRLLEDEFDQDTIGKVLVPIVRKVLAEGEGSLTANEKAALNVIRNTSGLQLFLQNAFGGLGGDIPTAAPPAAAPPAAKLDLKNLSPDMQELIKQARELLEAKGEEPVKKLFLERGGSEQVFNQFVLGR